MPFRFRYYKHCEHDKSEFSEQKVHATGLYAAFKFVFKITFTKPDILWNVNVQIAAVRKRIQSESSISSCLKCNRTFKSKEGLIFHDRVAHKEKKSYKCEICGGEFADNYHLKRHISAVHEEKKPLQCEICNSFFVGQTTYERHISTVHDGKKQFRCETCHTSFSLEYYLKHSCLSLDEYRMYVSK